LSGGFGDAARDWLGRVIGAAGHPLRVERMDSSTSSSPFLVEGPCADIPAKFMPEAVNCLQDAAEEFDSDPHWDVDSSLGMCLAQPACDAPWRHFGVDMIAPDELKRQVEAPPTRVMKRT
jgi:hypothetical protein